MYNHSKDKSARISVKLDIKHICEVQFTINAQCPISRTPAEQRKILITMKEQRTKENAFKRSRVM